MCLFSEFKKMDELINKSYGVVSVIVAIIIRANNGK